jgi:hypothetical protein
MKKIVGSYWYFLPILNAQFCKKLKTYFANSYHSPFASFLKSKKIKKIKKSKQMKPPTGGRDCAAYLLHTSQLV